MNEINEKPLWTWLLLPSLGSLKQIPLINPLFIELLLFNMVAPVYEHTAHPWHFEPVLLFSHGEYKPTQTCVGT